jgi:hypothetical protein
MSPVGRRQTACRELRLGIIGLIAGLYGIYLFYPGLPVLMRSPKEKAIGYTAVVFIGVFVVYVIIGALSARVVGGFMPGTFAPVVQS